MILDTRKRLEDDSLRAGPFQYWVFKPRRYYRLLESGIELARAIRDRLTILVIVRTRTEAHFLRSQVGIGSESDCLLGKLRRIFETTYSVRGSKVEKLEGVVDGAGE